MTYPLVVAASVGAAGCFSLSTVLKHRSAGAAPNAQELRPRQLGRFVAATVSHSAWLGGLLADAGGLSLQVYALHIGALAVVQPLLITSLLFALPLQHRVSRTRVSRRELLFGLLLVTGLAGFLLVSGATSASQHVLQQADRGPAVTAGALAVGLAAMCLLVARRLPRGKGAAMIGVAVGTTYAITAALIKSCTNIIAHGPVALLTSWQLYTLLAAGALGLVLNQLAFQAGPLTASLPAIATVDPLVSVALGIYVYDERLRHSTAAALGEVACLLLLSAAAFRLSRIEAKDDPSRLRPPGALPPRQVQ